MMVEIARARMSCFNQIPPPIPASGPRRVHPGQEAMPVADRALATFSIAAHLIADLKAEVEATSLVAFAPPGPVRGATPTGRGSARPRHRFGLV